MNWTLIRSGSHCFRIPEEQLFTGGRIKFHQKCYNEYPNIRYFMINLKHNFGNQKVKKTKNRNKDRRTKELVKVIEDDQMIVIHKSL